MTPDARAVVQRLRDALGDDAVTDASAGDVDARTSAHVSGRSVGAPICWARPRDTAQCAAVVRVARELGATVSVVGDASTFWDGLRVGGAVIIDARSLDGPFEIDAARRVALVPAGRTVEAVDRAAHAVGLSLAGFPDASGDSPVGTLVTVGTTAGLGMGRGLAIDQITAATIVTGNGEIVRLGASHALGLAPFMRHGLPDALGLVTAAEGRAAIITEVGLALSAAGFGFSGGASARGVALDDVPIAGALRVARDALDRGALDTLCIEIGCDGGASTVSWETPFRVLSLRDAADAAAEGQRFVAALGAAVGVAATGRPEADGHRRLRIPSGQHRDRVAGGAFWGLELATGWGGELVACLDRVKSLFHALSGATPLHRRIGVYPGHHHVSVGLQVVAPRSEDAIARTLHALSNAMPALLDVGVPYRAGNLWAAAMASAAPDAGATARALLARLDGDEIFAGPAGRR